MAPLGPGHDDAYISLARLRGGSAAVEHTPQIAPGSPGHLRVLRAAIVHEKPLCPVHPVPLRQGGGEIVLHDVHVVLGRAVVHGVIQQVL